MRPAHWWTGVAILSVALIVHAAVPRYEWRSGPQANTLVRLDRWTGDHQIRVIAPAMGIRQLSIPFKPEPPYRYFDPPPRVDPMPERALQRPLIGAS